MRRRTSHILLCALLLTLTVLPAHADTGPKPSVVVDILGLEGRTCYATLLSQNADIGPSRAAEPGEPVVLHGDPTQEEREAAQVFRTYAEEQSGGWYFLQELWDAGEGSFSWTYYPPDPCRIALWLPEEETVVVSQSCARYAFHSYYTVDLAGLELSGGAVETAAAESYDYGWESVSLAARVVLTVAVELAVAWLFRLREKKQIALILAVNIVTQLALNAGLDWRVYHCGTALLPFWYLLMELGVALAEGLVYWGFLPCRKADRAGTVVPYVLAANGASLILGWLLAHIIPGIF